MDDTELTQGINDIFNEIIFSANERARKHPLYHQLRDGAKEFLDSPDVFAIRFYTPQGSGLQSGKCVAVS